MSSGYDSFFTFITVDIIHARDTNITHVSVCIYLSIFINVGDNPTRKAVFDILVAGCIPVFLSKESFDLQYFIHLSHLQKKMIRYIK